MVELIHSRILTYKPLCIKKLTIKRRPHVWGRGLKLLLGQPMKVRIVSVNVPARQLNVAPVEAIHEPAIHAGREKIRSKAKGLPAGRKAGKRSKRSSRKFTRQKPRGRGKKRK